MDELTGIRGFGNEHAASRIRGISSFPFRGLRRFLCIAALSVVATLAFQSVAAAQETTGFTGECAGAAEQLQAERPNVPEGTIENYLSFIPEVGGCLTFEGTTVIGSLSVPVYDPDTGEEIGIVKDLDPDLSGGEISITYEEFCGGFFSPTLTAQDYFEQTANAAEQAILDPDGDGLACTDEDDAFLSGEGGESPGSENPQCIDGILDRDGDGQISPVEAAQAGADATQGGDPCSGADDEQYENDEDTGQPPGDETGGADDPYETEMQFEETWSGFITEFDEDGDPTGGYELEIEIMPVSEMTEDMIGEVVGRSRLSYGCTGTYFLEEVNEDSIRVEAPVETGFDNCVDGVHILTPQADGTLEHYSPEESNGSTSRGILTRGGSIAPYEADLPFEDTWTGPLTQTMPDGTTLDFELEADLMPISEMTEDMVGYFVGQTTQEGVECNGVWILEEVGEDSFVVEERITAGADYCVDSTTITLTPLDDGSLEYYFLDSYGSVGEGILTLQGGGVPEGDPEDVATDGRKPSDIMDDLGITELPDTGGPAILPPVGGLLLAFGMWGVVSIRRRT